MPASKAEQKKMGQAAQRIAQAAEKEDPVWGKAVFLFHPEGSHMLAVSAKTKEMYADTIIAAHSALSDWLKRAGVKGNEPLMEVSGANIRAGSTQDVDMWERDGTPMREPEGSGSGDVN